ncbi:MAG: type II toxin-antitoxin system VapC family toxin [Bacteroidota bacterium]
MGYLLDTHTLLWYIQGDSKLSNRAKGVISESDEVIVSIVSLWEIAIKSNLGKLEFADDISQIRKDIEVLGFDLVNISIDSLDTYQKLPLHHRDPFDRLLIAFAMTHGHSIIEIDAKFYPYPVIRVW